MKFSCDRRTILKKIKMAQKATAPKSNIAVLRNVLLDLSGDKLGMVGFDHRIGVKTSMECDVETGGRITVPCALMTEVLGTMLDDTVNFELDGDVMNMKCGKSTYGFNCINADDFPELPIVDEKDTFELDITLLKTGIRQTIFASNPDDPRAFMGGVLFDVDAGKGDVKFVATDGHRLAIRKFDIDGKNIPDLSAIVPSRAMSELLKILQEANGGMVDISIDKKSISFTIGDIFIISRLIEADYPKFEKVVPEKCEGSCRVNRTSVLCAVKGASIMARSKEHRDLIEISTTDDSINLSSSARDIGSANEDIDATKKGNDVTVSFNSKYITDFLTAVDDDEVIFEYTGKLEPGLFHTDTPDYKYVIMPIKV